MKRLVYSLTLIVTLMLCACNNEKSTQTEMNQTNTMIDATPAQLDGIKKALNAYVEAAIKGDSKIAKPVFAETATMSFNENDSLVSVPIQALFDYYDQTGPHHAEYEITSAHVAEDAAIVSIDSKFGDAKFDDMFTLVKDGADWKIISKIYHLK